jgi:hypothetical protein
VRFHYVVIYLLAKYVRGEACPGSDASELRWVTREESDSLDMHPLAREAMQQGFETL